jgi:hypothetical protein
MALKTFSTKLLKTSNLVTLAASLAVEKIGLMTGIVALGIFTTTPARAVPSPGPDAFGYSSTEITNTLRNISTTGTFIGLGDDQVSGAVPLGFNFDFYGIPYSQAYVSSNGFLTFNSDSDDGCCNGQFLPSNNSDPSNLIAGFWDDLNLPQGNIRYQTTGTAGSQQLVVGFYDVQHYFNGPPVTFEMILFEGSNNIELQYGNAPNDAPNIDENETVTIGITNNNSTDALTLVNFDPSLDVGVSNRGFLFSTHPVSAQPVPGPLPLLGVGAAFGYSRKLRKRIVSSKVLPVVSAIV